LRFEPYFNTAMIAALARRLTPSSDRASRGPP
jgi:hypothetical protein